MNEEALTILDYLPIRQDIKEGEYIEHLKKTFLVLDGADEAVQPFAITPFHLLFMMVVQYKVLRIYREQKAKYELGLIAKSLNDGERDVLAPESPLTIAFLKESEIIDLLKIAGLSTKDAQNIKKSIIRYRNDKIAHAKGFIETNLEEKISEYLKSLSILQKSFLQMNEDLAERWLDEITNEDDLDQFFETHFLHSCLSTNDFIDVIKKFLTGKNLNNDQWNQAARKGLMLAYNTMISEIRIISKNPLDKRAKNAEELLKENRELKS